MSEKSFIENIFGDQSRNPFPEESNISLSEAMVEAIPPISDKELAQYVNKDPELSVVRLEHITAVLQHNKDLLAKFTELVEQK